MKGIVFVELTHFVEEQFGDELLDDVLAELDSESGGAYTTVLTYPDEEFFALLALICHKAGISSEQAQRAFGAWLFEKLLNAAPSHAHTCKDVFTFLHQVENVIHVEVKKLNPGAILPSFTFLEQDSNRLVLRYDSPRRMSFFCEGLILGLAAYCQQKIKITPLSSYHKGDDECVFEVVYV